MRRALPLLACLALPACGGSGGVFDRSAREGPSRPADVIRAWADALRAGDVDRAVDQFALPAVVANGTGPLRLGARADIRAFNVALPCGARLLDTTVRDGYVVATFELTDRSGPGAVRPCDGRGARAATAFRIRGGKIREWRRVPLPGAAAPSMGMPT